MSIFGDLFCGLTQPDISDDTFSVKDRVKDILEPLRITLRTLTEERDHYKARALAFEQRLHEVVDDRKRLKKDYNELLLQFKRNNWGVPFRDNK
jgi:hypothetical protein